MVVKVLVTGGAGFIGSHLVDRLIECGYKVTVLDNLFKGKYDTLARHKSNPNLRFYEGEIRNKEDLRNALKGMDYVFHLAAIVNVPLSVENPLLVNEVNVNGTINVLEESCKADVKRLVFGSSCAVYGEPAYMPVDEDHPTKPLSPYGVSKLAGEHYCRVFYESKGFETVCLRFFNVYGPRQDGGPYARVIHQFIDRLKHGEQPIIFGDGRQTRDFVHVEDVVEACLLSINREECVGEVVNIGSGVETSINELAETMIRIFGLYNLEPKYLEERAGDIKRSCASLVKAEKILGYRPKTSLRDGLRKLIEAMKRE